MEIVRSGGDASKQGKTAIERGRSTEDVGIGRSIWDTSNQGKTAIERGRKQRKEGVSASAIPSGAAQRVNYVGHNSQGTVST